jgi:hypothetical protein
MLSWPTDASGRVSTTATGKKVWLDALAPLSSPLAAALSTEILNDPNWRKNYASLVNRMVNLQATSPAAECLASCAAGLESLNSSMLINDAPAPAAFTTPPPTPAKFSTSTVKGIASPAPHFSLLPPTSHTSFPALISHADLAKQARAWSTYGCIEESAGASLTEIANHPNPASLTKDKIFVLLGATSALGPFNSLAKLGATIACVARPGAKLNKLVSSAEPTAATLLLPTAADGKQGADLLADAPAIATWIKSLPADKQLVIGCYAYLDGEAHVRASVAMDLICTTVTAARPDTALTYLVSPATPHASSAASAAAAIARFATQPVWHGLLSPFGSFTPNVCVKNNNNLFMFDGLSNMQGPNYALAKISQQWRAMVAKADNTLVSANHAPAARTENMVSHASIAAALEGMQCFEPLVSFDPETASGLMCALLLWDLSAPASKANPANKDAHPFELLVENACHGGMWGAAYTTDSIGTYSFLAGKFIGPFTPRMSVGSDYD